MCRRIVLVRKVIVLGLMRDPLIIEMIPMAQITKSLIR